VRACHGDLHLRNICLLDGRPTPFDAIEFDPDLSRIDLLYDLAFLLMDLEGRGLRVPANIVFNRYHDMAGEADGMAALPLFLSLRAAIRAQVAAAAGRLQDPVDARGSRRLAARYLALALRLLQPAPTGLVAIGGLSGSGKSSLARRLAPVLGRAPGARLLRSDVIRKRLAGLVPEQRLDAARYTPAAAAAVYDHLTGAARACLAAGQSVVADAVFPRQAQRRAIEAAAGDANATFDGFWLDAPIDTLRRRMAARGIDASDATPDLLPAQQAGLEGEWLDWTRLDATQEAGGLARQAAALLARVPPD
jgi:predicted kinase